MFDTYKPSGKFGSAVAHPCGCCTCRCYGIGVCLSTGALLDSADLCQLSGHHLFRCGDWIYRQLDGQAGALPQRDARDSYRLFVIAGRECLPSSGFNT